MDNIPLYEAQVHTQLGRLDDADDALQRVLRLDYRRVQCRP